jgi:uracil-DNA glycosylase family 4
MALDGEGTAGVLLVGEALGAEEARVGRPFVGPAGRVLNDCIARAGFERNQFSIANALWCRPPRNDVTHPAVPRALAHCWDAHLLPAIYAGKSLYRVIMPLGSTAYQQFSGGSHTPLLTARGYVSQWRQHLLLPSVHPSYILRGNPNFEAVLIHDLQLAMRIATKGYQRASTAYVLDPIETVAEAWADKELRDPHTPIAFDIETRDKARDEDELDLKATAPIDRISFATAAGRALSIRVTRRMHKTIHKILESANPKIVWNAAFDCPRLTAHGFPIKGTIYDGMIAWHVLHSDLPKSLGFAASLLLDNQSRWKHLGREKPAYYNAIDSDAARRITLKTWDLLKDVGMWKLYQEQIVDCEPIFQRMHQAGMPIDVTLRRTHAATLDARLVDLDTQIQDVVPLMLKPKKRYKQVERGERKFPDGYPVSVPVEVQRCPQCGQEGRIGNRHPCVRADSSLLIETHTVTGTEWEVALPFVTSWQSIQRWQDFQGHQAIRRRGKRTTDETALRALLLKHPEDPLYPLVLDYREVQKLIGTYIGKLVRGKVVGGLPVQADGRCHPTITNNPDTLRTSMVNPNLQQIPHGGGLQALVKSMFVAPPGSTFWEIDYAGIEAVLVGYFARSPQLIRLARMGVHDYVNAYALHHLDKVIPASDLPQLEWDDATLRASLQQFKKDFPTERFVRKRLVHGHHYRMGPFKAQEVLLKELNRVVPVKDIKAFFQFYDDLFPEIGRWQQNLCLRVDGTETTVDPGLGIEAGAGWVRNPSGMIHRYFRVLSWTRVSDDSWTWTYGPSAKALIAFNPQHAAAAIGRRAVRTVAQRSPLALKSLRLFIHDSLVGECPVKDLPHIMDAVTRIMQQPVPWLPLPAAWGMGTHLAIEVEGQWGASWDALEPWEVERASLPAPSSVSQEEYTELTEPA